MKKSPPFRAKHVRAGKTAPARRSRSRPAIRSMPSDPLTAARLELTTLGTSVVLGPAAYRAVAPLRPVRFGYFKPESSDVHLVGSFNDWDAQAIPMTRDAFGDWSVEVGLPPGEHRYRFVVDGEWRDDPTAPITVRNPFGGFDAVMVVV